MSFQISLLDKLTEDLKNLLNSSNEFFDFTININYQSQKTYSIECHSAILSSRSEYFKGLLRSKMKEYQERKVEFFDIRPEIMQSFINYIYTGQIELNHENAIEMLVISRKFCSEELIQSITNYIQKNIHFENVIDLLELSRQFDFDDLKILCLDFICLNLSGFVNHPSFVKLSLEDLEFILNSDHLPMESELFILDSVVRWIEYNKNNENQLENKVNDLNYDQDIIKKLLYKIRWCDIPKKDIKNSKIHHFFPKEILSNILNYKKSLPRNGSFELKQIKYTQLIKEKPKLAVDSDLRLCFKPRIRFPQTSIIKKLGHVQLLQNWIGDNEFFASMRLVYSSKKDGSSPKRFHEKCNDLGKTLVLIETSKGFVFGGYTSIGWTTDRSKWREKNQNQGYGFVYDPKAFIFTIRNPKNYKPTKFPIQSKKPHFAIFQKEDHGPCFGYGDIGIINSFNEPLKVFNKFYSNFGWCYQLPDSITYGSKESYHFLAGSYDKWKLKEIEVFGLLRK
ncbi:pep-cterm sorting domain-containing protein [Anaeramoeba ignava]|uniref:Pep-cterm sorting domain-containing protein n=1 Tax=Anaeramoeba ignava TaxID=1746090 RepID=A0A9Q0LJL3_ANAIG|nr:pep-cterm sorting domain-containing protein [Anaeramoeba ignava]